MNALPLFSPEASTRICVTLLHSLWQVAALAAAAWVVGRLWRRRSVEWTYGVHVAALLACFAAVPATFVLTATPDQPAGVAGTPRAEPIGFAVEEPVSLPTRAVSKEPSPALQQPPIAEMQPQTTQRVDDQPNRVALWKLVAPWLAGLYVAGVALMIARLAAGIVRAERLRGRARPLDDKPIAEALDRLAGAWSMRVVPVLATAERIVVPKVVGLLRPTILLPASALSGLSAGELEMILAHELAHVRRHDMWVNLLQRLAEAALFFNPALWLLSRRISSLREYCCDELACRGAEPRGGGAHLRYAQALLRVVELSQTAEPGRVDTAALAASGRSPSELRRRVARLFGEPLREPLQLSRGGVLSIAAVLVLLWAPALWTAKAEPSEEPGKHSGAGLSFGGEVEIVGIGTNGVHSERWWNEEGEGIDLPDLRVQGATVSTDEDTVVRKVVFRVHRLPQGADVLSEIVPAGSSANGEPVVDGVEGPAGYYSRVFSLGKDAVEFRLRVAVAAGPWQKVAETDSAKSESLGMPDGKGLAFSEAMRGEHGTSVVVTHNLVGEDTRLIAVEKNGKRLKPIRSSSHGVGGDIVQTTWTFATPEPSRIDHFEFESRSYEWIEFPDLPAKPSGRVEGTSEKLFTAAVFHPEQISGLIAGGAAVNETNKDGVTPLWHAVRFSKPRSVQLLLEAGADTSIPDPQSGWTPLLCNGFCNSEPDSLRIAQLLLEHGADVNATEPRYRETPLHYAVSKGSLALTKLLLEAGADVNARSALGDTPLHNAVTGGKPEIADLLLDHGADPELRMNEGERPIDVINVISQAKAAEIQAVFRAHGADDQHRPELIKRSRKDAIQFHSDHEAMINYAWALAAGDFAALEKTWIFQDDLEREYAEKTAEMFARAKDMRVELVSLKRLSDESLFAMFLMFDGPKQSGKEPSPLPMTFRRQEGQWRCASPWNLRMTVNVQNMGVEKYGRRAQTQGMIAMSFGSEKGGGEWIAVLKAQAEAFELLAGPPYDLSQYEPIAKQIREQIEEQEVALKSVESREDLWRLVLEKEGKAILPEAGDFYLSFYLEAGKDTPNARSLPFADEVEPFLAEPFPCLTEEAVLKAEVVKNPDRNAPRIEVTLTDEGTKYFAKTTQQSIGKRLAIVVKGKVVAAPVIHSTISGGKAVIEGSFSFEEAEEIVEGLNAYRQEAREFLDNLNKEEGQPKGELPGAKLQAKPAGPVAAADVRDADRVVAEARARTFGLQGVPRIAFRQIYRQADVPGMREYGDDSLASLWKARAVEVTDDELDRNRHETLLAWDGDRLLLESFLRLRSGESLRSANYWDGRQGWIGEISTNEQGMTKGVQRCRALAKRPKLVKPFYYPQWAAAGDRLLWPGRFVLTEENNVDPSLTHYRSVGTETIDGVLCDAFDGPERHERIWIERATGLVKAASRYYVSDLTEKENWKVISDAAGREFDNRHDYELWLMDLTDLQEGTFEAKWHALTWEKAQPGNLAVFSDYHEVAPGVRWPHTVERIVVHSNHQAEYTEEFFHNVPDGTFNYSLAKITAEQVRDFDINKLAENALPEPGVKVTDRTGGVQIDYIWSDDLDEAEFERLRQEKLAEKRAEGEEAARRNNASSSDSIEVLTDGPKAESPTAPPAPH